MFARQGTQFAPPFRRHLELGAGYPRTVAAQAVSSVDKGEGPEALTDMSVNRRQFEPPNFAAVKPSQPDARENLNPRAGYALIAFGDRHAFLMETLTIHCWAATRPLSEMTPTVTLGRLT